MTASRRQITAAIVVTIGLFTIGIAGSRGPTTEPIHGS